MNLKEYSDIGERLARQGKLPGIYGFVRNQVESGLCLQILTPAWFTVQTDMEMLEQMDVKHAELEWMLWQRLIDRGGPVPSASPVPDPTDVLP